MTDRKYSFNTERCGLSTDPILDTLLSTSVNPMKPLSLQPVYTSTSDRKESDHRLMTLNPLFISKMFPPLALRSMKELFSLSLRLQSLQRKLRGGPSLSLCTLRGPRLTSLTHPEQKEKEKQEARGTRKGRKRMRVHTLIHALPSFSSSVGENKARRR